MAVVLSTYEEADRCASALLDSGIPFFGFDTERTFGRTTLTGAASIVQLSTIDRCFIFQVFRIYDTTKVFPPSLARLLQSTNIVKVAADAEDDTDALRYYGVQVRGIIDIQLIVRTMGIPYYGLKDLCRRFVPGYQDTKYLEDSWDWDGDLTPEQIQYATYDAWYTLVVYLHLFVASPIVRMPNVASK